MRGHFYRMGITAISDDALSWTQLIYQDSLSVPCTDGFTDGSRVYLLLANTLVRLPRGLLLIPN
jgi:hypothetical protein